MTELTPEKISAQDEARKRLRKLRQENETFFDRRDEEIKAAKELGMSLRDIGSEIGMSPQGVSNVLARLGVPTS